RSTNKKRVYAPKNAALYLAGLVTCASCGKLMVARSARMEYYCGTWDKHRVRGTLAESPCLRNGVKQEVIEEYIDKYLDETDQRLQLLTQGPDGRLLTDKLEKDQAGQWKAFCDGLERLQSYLMKFHPEQYDAIIRHDDARLEDERENVLANAGAPSPPK